MVDWSGVHSITVSMHEGMLTLALIAVVVRFLAVIVPKIPFVGWLFSDEFVAKAARYSETVAFIAALGGAIGIIASATTGTILFTPGGILSSVTVQNKVMMVIYSFTFWVVFLTIRLRFGDNKIWTNKVLTLFYPATALMGFLTTMFAGSIGGTLAGKETILEPFYQLFGIHKNQPWILPPITEFSKMVVNSPLKDLLNVSSILQIVIILNVVIIALVLIYVAAGAHSRSKT